MNATFYNYGLIFSWDWFLVYGACMFLLRAFSGLRLGFLVYENSIPAVRMWKSGAVILTEIALWAGGYLDFVWFMIEGAFPSLDKTWFWMPQSYIMGGFNYNTAWHAVYTIGWTLVLASVWYTVIKLEKSNFSE